MMLAAMWIGNGSLFAKMMERNFPLVRIFSEGGEGEIEEISPQ